jgi:hypothetical protein
LVFTITLISYAQFSYFAAQGQNPSIITQNNNTHLTYIPNTISKEAQEGLINLKVDPAMINSPKPDDLAG